MKHILTMLALCLAIVMQAQQPVPRSQPQPTGATRTSMGMGRYFEINPYVGYTTSSKREFTNGKYRAVGGVNFGGNLGFGKSGSVNGKNVFSQISLQYNFQPTDLEVRFYFPEAKYELGGLNVHTISIGGIRGAGTDQFQLFGGGYLGIVIYDPANDKNIPSDQELDGTTKFTPSFAGGFNYALSDRLGIRFQSQLYMPIWGADFGLSWCLGCGGVQPTAFTNEVSIYANFNGGIYYRLYN
jgi:hypothetical protein